MAETAAASSPKTTRKTVPLAEDLRRRPILRKTAHFFQWVLKTSYGAIFARHTTDGKPYPEGTLVYLLSVRLSREWERKTTSLQFGRSFRAQCMVRLR